jgi:hypothetical protein
MGAEFNEKQPGVNIFKTGGGVALKDRQTNKPMPIVHFPLKGTCAKKILYRTRKNDDDCCSS